MDVTNFANLGGWVEDKQAVEEVLKSIPVPLFSAVQGGMKDSGKGKTVRLDLNVNKVVGKFETFHQTIGDCQNPTDMVRMADGSEKEIQHVNVGDSVITPFGNIKKVLSTIKKPYNKSMVKIWVEGYNKPIASTPDHKYLVNQEWKEISRIVKEDNLFLPLEEYTTPKVTKIEIVKPDTNYVYCIEVADDHAFICNGYAIHNCVSMGMAQAINVLACTEIVQGELESWKESCATEPLYANGRILVGKGRLGYGDGSVGAWQAEAAQKYGFNIRKKYGNIDLSVYSGQRAKDWGNPGKGTPKELLEISKNNLIKQFTQVRTYEEARDAICSGYPVTVASNVGFSNTRDKYGCARRSGSWAHQMMFTASFDDGKDPALLCVNSWGKWNSGPQKFGDEPDGSFWVRAADVNVMLAANDSYCYSSLEGFPVRKINTRKWGGA